MPLEPYARGTIWWAKGYVEHNGRKITGYIRESTGATSEAGAREWIDERTRSEQRGLFVSETHRLTFGEAVSLYLPSCTPDMAKHMIPIVARFGKLPVADITPEMIRALAKDLYPNNAADTWRRWVITPARAAINKAHDLGKCPPIKIKGFTKEERVKQDRRRGKKSRVAKVPGSWEWLLQFRQHASKRHAALALFMFSTGARVGQSTAMEPRHLLLDKGIAIIPGAKGHDDREVALSPELVAELRDLKPITPRGWDRRYKANLRVFGFAGKDGPRKGWITACKRAGIPYLPPHSAGRHGFGQEMRVRQGVDKKAVGEFGGWSDTELLDRTYTHGEDSGDKIQEALRTGLVQAQNSTGLKLRKGVE